MIGSGSSMPRSSQSKSSSACTSSSFNSKSIIFMSIRSRIMSGVMLVTHILFQHHKAASLIRKARFALGPNSKEQH